MSVIGIAAKTAKADYAANRVYAYAKTSITLFDTFIQCWQVKYTYNTVRPETVINKYIDPNWRPYLQTPSSVSRGRHTCGHSPFSCCCCELLPDVYMVTILLIKL
jgi:hypothetical protein